MITASTATLSPGLTRMFLMVPSRSARRIFSIFMASITAKVSPALTSWPSATASETTRPGIGQRTDFSLAVAEGQEVKAGETLAVVEAMKMETILRAERDGTIKNIRVKPGESVAVDAVIMEFA